MGHKALVAQITEVIEIPGVRADYLAGSDGNIYRDGKQLKAAVSTSGRYKAVSVIFLKDNKRKSKEVHALVCAAFHGQKPSEKHQVAHKDGNGFNNLPENLSWKLPKDNLDDKFQHRTHDSGPNNSRAALDKDSLFVVRWLLENTSLSHPQIADIIGCNRTTVTRVNIKDRYGNVHVEVIQKLSDEKIKELSKLED